MNMNLVKEVVMDQLKGDIPYISSGDTIRIQSRIVEENKTRVQNFEGVVIKTQGSGITYSVLVRKISKNVGVEKMFSLHSPLIEGITILKRGHVRRARIYYMRNRRGKAARIKEIITKKSN